MKTKNIILTIGLMTLMSNVRAENFQFQNIRAGGTGCPSELTQIILAPDLSSASIIFQNFESHVPAIVDNPKATPYISILNCNIFLDIKLPVGQKLDSIEISYDMRGHAFLDKGVSGNFKSLLISSNGLGTERNQGVQLLQEKTWNKTNIDQEEDFLVQANKSLMIASQCNGGNGADRVSIHLQHQLGSQILGGFERTNASGTITMDTSDLTGGIKLLAHTSSCRNSPTPPTRGPGPGRNCRIIRENGRILNVCQ